MTTNAMEDDDHRQKRKHSGASSGGLRANPLAAARRSQQSTSDKIWHRKSGAGYHLFAQFYAGQPCAVLGISESEVSAAVAASEFAPSPTSAVADRPVPAGQGPGLSRAARRRKQRKGLPIPGRPPANGTSSSERLDNKGDVLSATRSIHPAFQTALRKRPELDQFFASLGSSLPLTLRIRHGLTAGQESDIRSRLADYSHLMKPYPWNERIYQALDNSGLTKQTVIQISPTLHQLLLRETSTGRLARQELGSMLPVLAVRPFLSPGDRVLDLCAAPGSKSLQVAELLGPLGRVRANDMNQGRLEAMQAAVQRSRVDSIGQLIRYASYDARHFPTSKEPYNCVLADVPCSGDGTCRKDAHILPQWTPGIANELHQLQVEILVRAFECVKTDGWVVYSTCSLNPVENEAVVSGALSVAVRKGISIELVVPPELSVGHPGSRLWRVADFVSRAQDDNEDGWNNTGGDDESDVDDEMPQIRWYNSYADANERSMDKAIPSMWPSTSHGSEWPLERCIRLLPQDLNCGGFFVALMHREN